MHVSSYRTLALVALVLLGPGGLLGCAGAGAGGAGPNIVTGLITPAHFRFKTVNALGARKDPAGWRAVCINAVMNNRNTGNTTMCKFEVGVPLRNREQGDVPLADAQNTCAEKANEAARLVMRNAPPGALTARVCQQFKEEYEVLLGEAIAGARVSECRIPGLETVVFDVTPLVDFFSPL